MLYSHGAVEEVEELFKIDLMHHQKLDGLELTESFRCLIHYCFLLPIDCPGAKCYACCLLSQV
jgi:hypothetical protein